MHSTFPQPIVWDPLLGLPQYTTHPSHGGLVSLAPHSGEIGQALIPEMAEKALNPSYMQVQTPHIARGTPMLVKATDGSSWLVQNPYPQQTIAPQHYPGVQYLAIQPQVMSPMPPHLQIHHDGIDPHNMGRTIAMSDVNRLLPGIEPRNILVPKRRSGQGNCVSFSRLTTTTTHCERSLRGNTVATRRRSQSFEGTEAPGSVSGFPVPLKKPSHVVPMFEGSESPDGSWVVPDPVKQRAVLEVLEYYFSDDCLSRNGYLLKQISQNEDGYVSIKRIAALKRMKSLTKDVRTVTFCARLSDKLETSDDNTMMRRKKPLPSTLEPPRLIRTVIAINLPVAVPTVESVTSLFACFGDLAQVRVLKPGKTLPPYLRDYTAWVPDLGKEYCALIEFESQEEAQGACREINMKNRDFNSLRVALLKPGARLRRTLYRKYKGDNETPELPREQSVLPKVCEGLQNLPVFSSKCFKSNISALQSSQSRDYDAGISGSGSDSDSSTVRRTANRLKYPASDSGYSHSNHSSGDERHRHSEISKPSYNRNIKRNNRSLTTENPESDSSDASGEIRMQRRASPINRIPVGIIRYPVGPRDISTKGFTRGFRKSLV